MSNKTREESEKIISYNFYKYKNSQKNNNEKYYFKQHLATGFILAVVFTVVFTAEHLLKNHDFALNLTVASRIKFGID